MVVPKYRTIPFRSYRFPDARLTVQGPRTMMKHAAFPLILLAGACTSDVTGVQTVDDLDGTSPDAYSSPGAIHCATTDAAARPVEVVLTPNGGGFDIADSTGAMFSLTS